MSFDAQDLISKLLNPRPELRPKVREIKEHPFFRGVDWDTILEAPGPFVPQTTR